MNWLYNILTDIWLRLEHSIGFKELQMIRLRAKDYEQLTQFHENRKKVPFLWIDQKGLRKDEPDEKVLRRPQWSHDCDWW